MGLAFLPWEKLPAWLLGPMMIALGVFFLRQAAPYSRHQIEAIAVICTGAGLFMYGVRKARRKFPAEGDHEK